MDGLRFGRQYRALRIRLERRQSDVAHDAGVSRSQISLIDRGRIDGVTIGSLVRAAAALGADVDVRLRWRGEHLDRLVDEGHAAVVELIVRRLRRLGWIADVEVSFSIWGERGSIDVFALHPGTQALLVVEVKSVVADSQATLHGLDRKVRLAIQIAKDRGWEPRQVSRLLVVAASATSRRRIARLATTYDTALPARGATVRRWLASPGGQLAGLLFVSVDSHDGTRARSVGRERVRRPKRVHRATQKAVDREPRETDVAPVDTGDVAVE
jgi:transcriptional regulator with XRE-family HTH domain